MMVIIILMIIDGFYNSTCIKTNQSRHCQKLIGPRLECLCTPIHFLDRSRFNQEKLLIPTRDLIPDSFLPQRPVHSISEASSEKFTLERLSVYRLDPYQRSIGTGNTNFWSRRRIFTRDVSNSSLFFPDSYEPKISIPASGLTEI